jgi:hypothetical protein
VKTQRHSGQSPDRDLNPGYSEYDAVVLSTGLDCVMKAKAKVPPWK